MRRFTRRSVVASAAGALLAARADGRAGGARPVILNDASRLNPVPVVRHVILRGDGEGAIVDSLRAMLKEAAATGLSVCAGGARHSMGGQSLVRDGIAVSPTGSAVAVDAGQGIYRVRSGARWRDVIAALDRTHSVKVMQSNDDFSVGGTLSVNAHGWAVPFGPFATTVRSFRLVLADGTLLTCSREENTDLFRLAIGGYGLFGIVLDADLELTPNLLLARRQVLMPAAEFASRFLTEARRAGVSLAYGRLSVSADSFLTQSVLVTFETLPEQPDPLPPAAVPGAYTFISRRLFRAQIGSDAGKRARWYAETVLLPRLAAKPITRNAILRYPVSALADNDPRHTDILHEYFLPPDRFEAFLAACREIIPAHKQDLLNVTLRHLEADPVSTLAFAPQPRIAAVLLFVYPPTPAADAAMQAMTELLIARAIELGGSFYLPYRLHARPDQVRAAYPGLDVFVKAKHHYDPELRFRNLMWDRYMA